MISSTHQNTTLAKHDGSGYIVNNRMKTIKLNALEERIPVGKIVCLGRNYADHAREMKVALPSKPVIFLKPSTALISDGETIVRPALSNELHHEVELVVMIGREGKDVSPAKAYEHVWGYAVGLDMTLRDIQVEAKDHGLPWAVAKGFDTSAPISEIIPKQRVPDPHALEIRCWVNGTVRQKSSTGNMIFSIDQIISYVSSIFTLELGDLIFTGTPEGVGEVKNGDTVAAELVGYTKITHQIQTA